MAARTVFFGWIHQRAICLDGTREVVAGALGSDPEAALEAADRAWDDGHLDFIQMEDYLASLVAAQLEDDGPPYEGAPTV